MNKEIEVKVKIKNHDEVKKNVSQISKFVKEKKQIDYYFVPKDNDFFLVSPTKEYLRVRVEGQNGDKVSIGHHLCIYDKNKKLLRTDENETDVTSKDIIFEILEKLGFTLKVTVSKHREVYDYENYEISLDMIKELGDFLEVEVKKITEDESKEKIKCYEVIEKLNAKYSPADSGGYPDMILRLNK